MREKSRKRRHCALGWRFGAVALTALPLSLTAQETPPPATEEAQPPALPVELIDPSPHLPGLPGWILYLLIAFALVISAAVVMLIIHLGKNKESTLHRGESPFDRALAKLESFREQPDDTPLSEITTHISLTLRSYLAAARSDSALYQTREEFLTDEERLRHVQEPARSQTADFLAELSSLQYAPPTSDPEHVTQLIDQSIRILHNLAEPSPSSADHA